MSKVKTKGAHIKSQKNTLIALCRKDGLLLRRLNLLHGKTPLIQFWIYIFSSPSMGYQ
jgi:hypothetical protein